jgi:hypothetical protein
VGGVARCAVPQYQPGQRKGRALRRCRRLASVLTDEMGRPICAGHHAQEHIEEDGQEDA